MIVGGVGTGEFAAGGAPNIKGSILMVDDVLYVTAPDNVWALDAHDGHVIWQYYWKTRGGTHIGNRGAALRYTTLYFETPDNYLVAIDCEDRVKRNGTSRLPTSSSSTSRRPLRSSSTTMSSSAPVMIWMRRAFCSRTTPTPASCSGSCTWCR